MNRATRRKRKSRALRPEAAHMPGRIILPGATPTVRRQLPEATDADVPAHIDGELRRAMKAKGAPGQRRTPQETIHIMAAFLEANGMPAGQAAQEALRAAQRVDGSKVGVRRQRRALGYSD